MRYVFFWLIMLMCLFHITSAHSDEGIAFKMGPGLDSGSPTGSIKTFSIRHEQDLIYAFKDAIEGGFYVDNLGFGRSSSAFGKYQLGVAPGPEVGVFAKAFAGIAFINATDTVLGGNFQFSEDVGVGVRDESSFVEMGYTHFSSAGISSPNHGRDFLTFSFGVRY